MKRSIFFIAAFLFCTTVIAQNNYSISGKVMSDVSGLPLQAASVFAQNTTIGTVTDAEGNFTLILPNGGYDLIVSFTGYKTDNRRITTSDATAYLNIKLKEKEKELEVVSVVASTEVKDGLEKYGQFFKDEFIGKTINSKSCNLLNPEVLHFYFSKKKNRLKIMATEPLIIKNAALGYNIKYALDSFTHEYKTEVSIYSGYPLYENIKADTIQILAWAAAREAAYRGSLLQFMRSVYHKDLAGNKFEIQFIIKANGREDAIKIKDVYAALNYTKDDSTQTVELLPNQSEVAVLFLGAKPSMHYLAENNTAPKDFKFSMLSFKPKESIIVEANGYFYDQNDITVSGYWAWDKVADQLPYDY